MPFECYGRYLDVKTTLCAYWDHWIYLGHDDCFVIQKGNLMIVTLNSYNTLITILAPYLIVIATQWKWFIAFCIFFYIWYDNNINLTVYFPTWKFMLAGIKLKLLHHVLVLNFYLVSVNKLTGHYFINIMECYDFLLSGT